MRQQAMYGQCQKDQHNRQRFGAKGKGILTKLVKGGFLEDMTFENSSKRKSFEILVIHNFNSKQMYTSSKYE